MPGINYLTLVARHKPTMYIYQIYAYQGPEVIPTLYLFSVKKSFNIKSKWFMLSNLGSMLLCIIITKDGLIDVKNELILWKLSSIQNGSIEWPCVQIEFEFKYIYWIWFNNWIMFSNLIEENWDANLVEKVSKLYSWVQCFQKKKNTFKRHKFIKTHFLFTWKWAKNFQFETLHMKT